MALEIVGGSTDQSIRAILSTLGINYKIKGKQNIVIDGIASIEEAKGTELTFCSSRSEAGISAISNSNAAVILCNSTLETLPPRKREQTLIFVDNPRLVFIQIVNRLFESNYRKKPRISHLSDISDSSEVGNNCSIGSFATIGDNCVIGDNVVISNRVSLQHCIIGDSCVIQPGVCIGYDGFAFERNDSVELEVFPHFKRVIIGNNVEVRVNSSIARGSLKDTVIGDGTKIDALVHVGHNARIGTNCVITAGSVIGGSTVVGHTCWLGINSVLKNKIKIGNNVIIGAGASVISDIPDEDIVAGVPAKSIKYKVNSDQLFLMAGLQKQKVGLVQNSSPNLHY